MPAPAFSAPTDQPRTYTGICRCKATKYTVELPSLTSGHRCNCSLCTMHDALWLFLDGRAVQFEREGPQIVYEWGNKRLAFCNCATCGNFLYGKLKADGQIILNLRLFQDVDVDALKTHASLNSAGSTPPLYAPPAFQGPAFRDDADDKSKTDVYYGSCHCGACTVALRTVPLAEARMNECNCAYCWKGARVHVYPSSDDVHLHGVENLEAFMSNPLGGGFFCKTCGVGLFDADMDGAHDGRDQPIVDAKERLGHDLRICAINVRALHGVDWESLKVNKYDGRSNDPQFVAD